MKKRIRKKLRLGEFQEIGFELTFAFEPGPTVGEENEFLFDFLDHAIECNHLLFGGGGQDGHWSGVVYRNEPRGISTTAEQRATVLAWLNDHPRVITAKASGFFDLWYDDLPSERHLNTPADA